MGETREFPYQTTLLLIMILLLTTDFHQQNGDRLGLTSGTEWLHQNDENWTPWEKLGFSTEVYLVQKFLNHNTEFYKH